MIIELRLEKNIVDIEWYRKVGGFLTYAFYYALSIENVCTAI